MILLLLACAEESISEPVGFMFKQGTQCRKLLDTTEWSSLDSDDTTVSILEERYEWTEKLGKYKTTIENGEVIEAGYILLNEQGYTTESHTIGAYGETSTRTTEYDCFEDACWRKESSDGYETVFYEWDGHQEDFTLKEDSRTIVFGTRIYNDFGYTTKKTVETTPGLDPQIESFETEYEYDCDNWCKLLEIREVTFYTDEWRREYGEASREHVITYTWEGNRVTKEYNSDGYVYSNNTFYLYNDYGYLIGKYSENEDTVRKRRINWDCDH